MVIAALLMIRKSRSTCFEAKLLSIVVRWRHHSDGFPATSNKLGICYSYPKSFVNNTSGIAFLLGHDALLTLICFPPSNSSKHRRAFNWHVKIRITNEASFIFSE